MTASASPCRTDWPRLQVPDHVFLGNKAGHAGRARSDALTLLVALDQLTGRELAAPIAAGIHAARPHRLPDGSETPAGAHSSRQSPGFCRATIWLDAGALLGGFACYGLRRMDQITAEVLVSRAAKARTKGASMMITGDSFRLRPKRAASL